MHSVENEKFSLTKTIFREIKSVGTIGKTLLSRNFFQKCLRVNFPYFHTVLCTFAHKLIRRLCNQIML